jgi:phage terminase large subunit-like protein
MVSVRRTIDGFRPWWAQRLAARLEREATITLGVTGRQAGKTSGSVWRVLARALRAPGAMHSLILVPTYRHGLVHAGRLKEWAGAIRCEWKEQKQLLLLANGHHVWLRSTDRPDAVRGMTITTTLWVDEATLISEAAWKAALGCLVAAQDPRVLVTATPKGKSNWVWRLWSKPGSLHVARFLCRSQDSPYAGPILEVLRETMGGAMAAQELDGMFVDSGAQPFPPELVDRMIRPCRRRPGSRWVLGADLGKQHDWTVVVATDETGACWVVGRWRHVEWPDTERRLVQIVNDYNRAHLFVDSSGLGGPMADYLARVLGPLLHEVKTGAPGVKADLIETLVAEAEHGRMALADDSDSLDVAREELLTFSANPRPSGNGIDYSGDGDHDDCVIALAISTWGRLERWGRRSGGRDLEAFAEGFDLAPRVGGEFGDWSPIA